MAGGAKDATFIEVKMSNILSSCQAKSVAKFALGEFMAPALIYIGEFHDNQKKVLDLDYG